MFANTKYAKQDTYYDIWIKADSKKTTIDKHCKIIRTIH